MSHNHTDAMLSENLSHLGIDDDVHTLPSFGSPALSLSDTATTFASGTTEMGNIYWAYPFQDDMDSMCAAYIIVLNSVPPDHYTFRVSECGWFTEISCRLPSVLTDVEKLTTSIFKKASGGPMYDRGNGRTVAHKQAVTALLRGMGLQQRGQDVTFKQQIRNPFKCHRDLHFVDGREGVTIKRFATGMVLAVLEVIQESCAIARIEQARNERHNVETVTLAGNYTTIPVNYSNAGGRSVVTLDPQTGFPRGRRSLDYAAGGVPIEVAMRNGQLNAAMDMICESDENESPSVRKLPNGKKLAVGASDGLDAHQGRDANGEEDADDGDYTDELDGDSFTQQQYKQN